MNASQRFLALLSISLGLLQASCGGGSGDAGPVGAAGPEVARIEVTPSTLSLAVDAKAELTYAVFDPQGNRVEAAVTWQSSNPASVVVVGSVAQGIADGEGTLIASIGAVNSTPVLVRVAAPISTEALIQSSLSKGTIDANTALKYRVFAAFRDPRLPFALTGNIPGPRESDVLIELARALGSMPSEEQAVLQPYLIPPIYDNSWYALRVQGKVPVSTAKKSPLAKPPKTCLQIFGNWKSTNSEHFKVWYERPQDEDLSLTASVAAERAYAKLASLGFHTPLADDTNISGCHGGDDRVDIYLVDAAYTDLAGNLGTTNDFDEILTTSPFASFLLLRRTPESTEAFQDTVVHEYMHTVQLTYRNMYYVSATDQTALRWLRESTAQWSEGLNRSNRKNGDGYLRLFVDSPSSPLWSQDPIQKLYGSYVFFQFVSKVTEKNGSGYGNDGTIKSIYEAIASQNTASLDVLGLVDASLPRGLTKTFNDFTVAMLKLDENLRFSDIDVPIGFEPEVVPRVVPALPKYAEKQVALSLEAPPSSVLCRAPGPASVTPFPCLSELSAYYETFDFTSAPSAPADAPDIASLAFYNGYTYALELQDYIYEDGRYTPPKSLNLGKTWSAVFPNSNEAKGRSLQAFINIGGIWRREDWTNVPSRFFCRQSSAEKVLKIILIHSNGNFSNARGEAELDTNALGPLQMDAPDGKAGGLPSTFVMSRAPCHEFAGSGTGTITIKDAANDFFVRTRLSGIFAGAPTFNYLFSHAGRTTLQMPGVNFKPVAGDEINSIHGRIGCAGNFSTDRANTPPDLQTPKSEFTVFSNLERSNPNQFTYAENTNLNGFTIRCANGSSIETPAPLPYGFNAMMSPPDAKLGAMVFVDENNTSILTDDKISGPTPYPGSFPGPVNVSSWCLQSRQEGVLPKSSFCPP